MGRFVEQYYIASGSRTEVVWRWKVAAAGFDLPRETHRRRTLMSRTPFDRHTPPARCESMMG